MDARKPFEEEEDEVKDFNLKLKQFFEEILPKLYDHSLDEVPVPTMQEMAQQLHRTLYRDRDWQGIVYDMGVKDNKEIGNLDMYSKLYKELPILLALQGPLSRYKSYGHIVWALLTQKRFDVLKDLKDFTESLVYGNSASVGDEISSVASNFSCVKFNSSIEATIADFYECTEKDSPACEEVLLKSCSDAVKTEKTSETKLVVALPDSFISVFIPHTDADTETAQRLSSELREQGIVVKLLSEVEDLLALNRTRALSAILREVDFVSPILSESYLQEIYPSRFNVKSQEAMSNCYVFNQIHSELLWDGCMNFRVRPVIVPQLNRQLLNLYPAILKDSSFRLWSEVTKLAKNLKNTKPMLEKLALS